MALVTGGNATHYWEDSGVVGRLYDELLGFDGIYAWDIWFIYKPGVEWTDRLPPRPDFTMHQLGPLKSKFDLPFLDSEIFAEEVTKHLASVARPSGYIAARSPDSAAGAIIEKISQPAGVAVGQHIKGRGGYQNLKRIESIRMVGTLTVGGESGSITIEQNRPAQYRRSVRFGDEVSVASAVNGAVTFEGLQAGLGLPDALERMLLSNFEFDGFLVDWKEKGHGLRLRIKMEKLPGHLAWVLGVTQPNDTHWRLHIDSHEGHLLKQTLLDANGQPLITMEFARHQESLANPLPQPFRLASGTMLEHYVLPRSIVYRDPRDRELARIDIENVTIQTSYGN